jgi:hypothetical protein
VPNRSATPKEKWRENNFREESCKTNRAERICFAFRELFKDLPWFLSNGTIGGQIVLMNGVQRAAGRPIDKAACADILKDVMQDVITMCRDLSLQWDATMLGRVGHTDHTLKLLGLMSRCWDFTTLLSEKESVAIESGSNASPSSGSHGVNNNGCIYKYVQYNIYIYIYIYIYNIHIYIYICVFLARGGRRNTTAAGARLYT